MADSSTSGLGEANAEVSVLGGMLRDNRVIPDVVVALSGCDFSTDAHEKIYRSILSLYEDGKPADLVSVSELLSSRKHLQDVRPDYMGKVWESEATGANAVYYAGIVRGNCINRRLGLAGAGIADRAKRPTGSAEEMLDLAEKEVFSISQIGIHGAAVPIGQCMDEAMERIDARSSPGAAGSISTGLMDLDKLTGGLHNGEVVILAARTSVGKTAMGVFMAYQAALRGDTVLFVSLEQGRAELGLRILCMHSGVDGTRIRMGKPSKEEIARITEARKELDGKPLFIDDTPTQGMSRIGAGARRMKMKHDVKLLVVDYLQFIDADDRREQRHEQVASCSRRLKQLARELNVPVLALAQLNRAAEESDRPKLSHLRESGAIEQDADVVLFMHRRPADENVIELIVAKQRNGPTGEVPLVFNKSCMRFSNYAAGEPNFG